MTEDFLVEDLQLITDEAEAGWWTTYRQGLLGAMHESSVRVLEADARHVWRQASERPNEHSGNWLRTGLVLGAVQSGKTASMLGVAALGLDDGLDIVIVLAGTRLALWRQTFDRLHEQLGGVGDAVRVPAAEDVNRTPTPKPVDLYATSRLRARRALRDREPIVIVVMKQADHLRAIVRVLHESVYPDAARLDRKVTLLVLDDEADDGSVLDAIVEQSAGLDSDKYKQLPRLISDLWATRANPDAPAIANLEASYVAYTATPQANILQADQNPLAPRDFIAALRTPADAGHEVPREPTFRAGSKLSGYYTGGATFYERIAGPGSLVVTSVPRPPVRATWRTPWIADSMRSFLVAAAIRRWRDPTRDLTSLEGVVFESRRAATEASPAPHTMLFHPSGVVAEQFEAVSELLAWGTTLSRSEAQQAIADGQRSLSPEVIAHDISNDPGAWSKWLESFRVAAKEIAQSFALPTAATVPADDQWDTIRELIINEVTPTVRLRIVNSDPDADDRPVFAPRPIEGGWTVAPDLLTVFVSGNVMARGLTLEGLTTTLFLRRTGEPIADTQMQMQRWFGYRGSHLELCRVFLTPDQASLFLRYHDNDVALRKQVLRAMDEPDSSRSGLEVLEGDRFRATAKIARAATVPLCPGAAPFIDIVNDGTEPDPNLEHFQKVFDAPTTRIVRNGIERGRLLEVDLSLTKTADVLDGLRYTWYRPDEHHPLNERWHDREARLWDPGEEAVEAPLFRPPPGDPANSDAVPTNHCPYSIAAYLRLWSAALSRRPPGLVATDRPDVPWSRLDLARLAERAPRFRVGVRFGAAKAHCLSLNLGFTVRPVERQIVANRVTSWWGSRTALADTGYEGDEVMDRDDRPLPPLVLGAGGRRWRPVGSAGLLLFYVAQVPGRPFPVVTAGIAIPLGGPDHFATRPRT